MLRRMIVAAAAVAALGVLAIPQTASARYGGWYGGHSWHGGHGWHGWHGGWRHRPHWGWRHGFPRYGFYRGGYGAYAGCIRWRQVPTPWGFQWRRVNVCY